MMIGLYLLSCIITSSLRREIGSIRRRLNSLVSTNHLCPNSGTNKSIKKLKHSKNHKAIIQHDYKFKQHQSGQSYNQAKEMQIKSDKSYTSSQNKKPINTQMRGGERERERDLGKTIFCDCLRCFRCLHYKPPNYNLRTENWEALRKVNDVKRGRKVKEGQPCVVYLLVYYLLIFYSTYVYPHAKIIDTHFFLRLNQNNLFLDINL